MATDLDSVELIPDETRLATGDEELNAASDLLDYDPDQDFSVLPDTPMPFGKSWVFDFGTGQFVRYGSSPAECQGLDTLRQWVLLCMETDRGAHPVLGEDFGVEDLHSIIGQQFSPAITAEYQRTVTEALLQHDRIEDISDFEFNHDPTTEVLDVSFVITTDADEDVAFSSSFASAVGTY